MITPQDRSEAEAYIEMTQNAQAMNIELAMLRQKHQRHLDIREACSLIKRLLDTSDNVATLCNLEASMARRAALAFLARFDERQEL